MVKINFSETVRGKNGKRKKEVGGSKLEVRKILDLTVILKSAIRNF
jgi:hypothetical protein